MAKDPAFLFYSSDFITGTLTMTNEQVGKYVRLLCLQHQRGQLNEKDMLFICGTFDEIIFEKFEKVDGKYINQRLFLETEKRKKHSENQRENVKKRWNKYTESMPSEYQNNTNVIPNPYDGITVVIPLENENVNVNVIEKENKKITDLNKKRSAKKNELQFPYESENFKRSWAALVAEPKWRKKTHGALQASLVKLSKYSEQDAVDMMQDAIAGNYQGLFPTKKQNGFNDKRSQADQFNNAINAAVEDIFGSGSNGQQ